MDIPDKYKGNYCAVVSMVSSSDKERYKRYEVAKIDPAVKEGKETVDNERLDKNTDLSAKVGDRVVLVIKGINIEGWGRVAGYVENKDPNELVIIEELEEGIAKELKL
ncbi:MAG: hypothetical protein ABIH72_00185 [archaeon]